ncbi:MAG TPA: hypothetical protein VME18_06040 [Acidobacteriaceae bacterium]|nr:hypothetical protein [Acidobacteriaceae bacterium]
MLQFRRMVWDVALAAVLPVTLAAQQAPTPTHTYTVLCVKVKSGQDAAFASLVSGDLHKLEQARVDSGALSGWLVLRTVIPAGRAATCDYSLVAFYTGWPKPGMNDAELKAAMQQAGIAMTQDEWDKELGETGYLVSDGLDETLDLVGEAHVGDYLVFNSMSVTDVRAWISWEKRMWDPLAQSLVKSGKLSGWAMNIQMFPRGAEDPDLESTVDIFPNWEAFVQARESYEAAWKSVHQDADMMTAMGQFGKVCTIEHSVLQKVVDQINGK